MDIPWGILISLVIVGLAYLIKYFVDQVAEEKHHFWGAIAVFFVMYAVAAIGIAFVNPHNMVQASTDEMQTEAVDLNAP